MGNEKFRIGIYGLGRLGMSLTLAMFDRGFPPIAVGSHRIQHRDELPAALRDRWRDTPVAMVESADLIFLTVRDDVIPDLVQALARHMPSSVKRSFIHCSGALGPDVFQPLLSSGHPGAVFHPLNSFPNPETGRTLFDGTWIGLHATDPELEQQLMEIAKRLNGHPLILDAAIQPLYHLVAVLVANAPVVLAEWGVRLLTNAGKDRIPWEAYRPLIQTAMKAMQGGRPIAQLTGPWVRGDRQTIERHLATLEALDPERKDLYRALWRAAIAFLEDSK